MKFDLQLVTQVLTLLTQGLAHSPTFEIQSDIANCLNYFCEFVFEKLKRKPSDKSAYLT